MLSEILGMILSFMISDLPTPIPTMAGTTKRFLYQLYGHFRRRVANYDTFLIYKNTFYLKKKSVKSFGNHSGQLNFYSANIGSMLEFHVAFESASLK